MTNAYADHTTIKSTGVLNITGTTYDTSLRQVLETASRLIDQYCNRHFYVLVATRKYDGDGGTELLVPDLISVTILKTDDDLDRTFEATWAASDYLLYHTNADPTKLWGRPYTSIHVDTDAGAEDVFTKGMQTVQIDGKWGYREVTEDSDADINEGAQSSATDTTLTVTDGSKFAVGQTILIDSEQLYITAISTNDLTVSRGLNGTTAAVHNDSSDISIYRYPGPVVEACLINASRIWKLKDSGLAAGTRQSRGDRGTVLYSVEPDIRQLLTPYRRLPVGVGTS